MQQNQENKKSDRLLGDEWENWTGDLDESGIYRETAALFSMFATIAVFILAGIIGLVLYLIEPRLALINPVFVIIARIVMILSISGLGIWGVLMLVSVGTGRNFIYNGRIGQMSASVILPLALSMASRFGISRDRLGNSFITFSNAIVRATHRHGGKIIVLMPRCLKPDQMKFIREVSKKAGVDVFPATGGGQARKIIREQRPTAVIGIACERDLMSGIHDVVPKIPAIGVANKRPEGPCKNTEIDIEDLKTAIETLTGVKV